MRRPYQVAGLVFIALGSYIVLESRRLTYYTSIGPGPGFFPFWLGIAFTGLSIAWLLQTSLRQQDSTEGSFAPSTDGILRIVAIVLAVVLFAWAVDTVGFQLTMLAFLLFLLVSLGRQSFGVTVIVSLAGSFGVYYLFKNLLGVELPTSSIEFLENLNL